jgi:Periplasmic protein TonB, links inner and outer membranes
MVNHFKSGFSILEFVVDVTGNIANPKVVKSSGQLFDQIVLNSLDEFELVGESIHSSDASVRYRLPIYFKNKVTK